MRPYFSQNLQKKTDPLQQLCPLCHAVGGTSACHQRGNHRWHRYWERKKVPRCRSAALEPKPEDQLKKKATDLQFHIDWGLCHQSDMQMFTHQCLEVPFHVKGRFLFRAVKITNKIVLLWYSPHMTGYLKHECSLKPNKHTLCSWALISRSNSSDM